MSDTRPRLITCFSAVFPDLAEAQIPSATVSSVQTWDSIAMLNLVNVIEEEFKIEVDFDAIPELDSFAKFLEYVEQLRSKEVGSGKDA
jgi:acyl carrier protein